MENLFVILFLISSLALFVFLILWLLKYLKKDTVKGKQMLKFTGISLIIAIVSFIGIGSTLDSETTESDKKEVATEEQPKETEEEKATRTAKEAAEAEQEAKEEAAAKAKAEEEARLKAEAEAKAKADEAAAKKANAQTIEYAQLKKNPDRYAGEYVKYTGEILQIIEGDETTHIRLAVTQTSYGYDFNDVIFIEYDGYTDYVDGDIITVFGEIYGSYSYESQAGYNISLPGLIADSFE